VARVLGDDEIDFAQSRQQTQRHVVEVADWRGANVKSARCGSHEVVQKPRILSESFPSTRGLDCWLCDACWKGRGERLRCQRIRSLATATAQGTRSLTALFLPVCLHFALVLFLVGTQKTSPSLKGSSPNGFIVLAASPQPTSAGIQFRHVTWPRRFIIARLTLRVNA
jgi:hypothetical protein